MTETHPLFLRKKIKNIFNVTIYFAISWYNDGSTFYKSLGIVICLNFGLNMVCTFSVDETIPALELKWQG